MSTRPSLPCAELSAVACRPLPQSPVAAHRHTLTSALHSDSHSDSDSNDSDSSDSDHSYAGLFLAPAESIEIGSKHFWAEVTVIVVSVEVVTVTLMTVIVMTMTVVIVKVVTVTVSAPKLFFVCF